ncbi:MAG: hypothetical protein BWY96_02883 [Spirochaetes bacterium ADurb.BinA120]|nr:MAG: hypothetical protein BWY96_02883 [Spirochaetes bacterium ADurb.BinA120]
MNILFFLRRYEATCRMTDSASTTNTPPTMKRNTSFFIIIATMPTIPPSASDPVSPMNTEAGLLLNQRKPIEAPVSAERKTVSSAPWGMYGMRRYAAIFTFPDR